MMNKVKKKKAVCGFGAYINLYIKAPSSEHTRVTMTQFKLMVAGTATSTGRTLNSLGVPTTIFTALGEDPQADWIKSELKNCGISFIALPILKQTPWCVNIVAPDGSYKTYEYRQGFVNLKAHLFRITEEVQKQDPVLLLASGITPYHRPLVQAMWKGAPKALKVLVPSSSILEQKYDLTDLFRRANLIITNHKEAGAWLGRPFFGKKEVQKLYKQYQRRFVVTAGKDGSYMVSENGLIYQPALKINKVHDTIGCGDAYIAGLLKYLMEGKSPQQAMEYASVVSAVATTKLGVTSPTIEEVEDFIQKGD